MKTSYEIALECLEDINKSVFPNGKENLFYDCDVFEFLDRVRGFDTLYIDPPYYGSESYEQFYTPINKILTQGHWQKPDMSVFNKKESYMQAIRKILEVTSDVPQVIFSYGGIKGIDDIENIKNIFREVRGVEPKEMSAVINYAISARTEGSTDGKEAILISTKNTEV
jgi:adenine-specific DNA methylase